MEQVVRPAQIGRLVIAVGGIEMLLGDTAAWVLATAAGLSSSYFLNVAGHLPALGRWRNDVQAMDGRPVGPVERGGLG